MTDEALTLDSIRGRAAISVPEAAQLLGVAKSTAFEAARAGRIPAVRIGDRRIVVPVPAFLAMLEGEGP